MTLWFISIALLGLWGVTQHPGVLMALDPRIGLAYTFTHGHTSFFVLGGVFLCVSEAEALYADMGHVGARPIRLAWYALVLPSLLLNYAGQTALVLSGAPIQDNIFYRLCPAPLLLPLILLATVATIIASQSIITGAFSMTRQAIQLGWCPRLQIESDFFRRLWPDLRRCSELASNDRNGWFDHGVRHFRPPGGRLWHRSTSLCF